jgi:hypothetical protein
MQLILVIIGLLTTPLRAKDGVDDCAVKEIMKDDRKKQLAADFCNNQRPISQIALLLCGLIWPSEISRLRRYERDRKDDIVIEDFVNRVENLGSRRTHIIVVSTALPFGPFALKFNPRDQERGFLRNPHRRTVEQAGPTVVAI